MPRYYFDVHEGDHEAVDEDGLDCPNIEAAQREAFLALSDIARMEARSSSD